MAKSKPPRKKKAKPNRQKILRTAAEQCVLFRWSDTQDDALIPLGPPRMPKALMDQCVDWAMTRPNVWIVEVYAAFVAGADYYEHDENFYTDQIVLKTDREVWNDALKTGRKVMAEGNPNHYVDTVIILRLKTERAIEQLADDEWCLGQTLFREKSIRQLAKSRARKPIEETEEIL